MEGWGFRGDPVDEAGDFWVLAELVERVVVACEFGFAEDGVDFAVAGDAEGDGGFVFAAAEFRGEVVA